MKKRALSFLIVIIVTMLSACGHTHSVQVGTCSECGEFQNQELVDSISQNLETASSELTTVVTYINSASRNSPESTYKAMQDSKTYINSAKQSLEAAEELCGDYAELDGVKTLIRSAICDTPTSVRGSDLDSLNMYLDELRSFAVAISNAQLKLIGIT